MPFKKHTPEETIGKLREAEIVLTQAMNKRNVRFSQNRSRFRSVLSVQQSRRQFKAMKF